MLPAICKSAEEGYESFFMAEKISKLNYPKKGEFITIEGTTGPIKGNLFIKIQKNKPSIYWLIDGRRNMETTKLLPNC